MSDIQLSTGWNTQDNTKELLKWWDWTQLLETGNWRAVTQEIGDELSSGQALMKMFEWDSRSIL